MKGSTQRDPATLKCRLSQRLKSLKSTDADFASTASVITVQEILRWQFGDGIFQHPDINRIITSIAKQLAQHDTLKSALQNVIRLRPDTPA